MASRAVIDAYHDAPARTGAAPMGKRRAPEAPSALLLRAADLIEQRAIDAGPGWVVYQEGGIHTDTFAWLELLNPAMGAPLAAWLRLEAEQIQAIEHLFGAEDTDSPSVEFARRVLGEPVDETGPDR